MHFLFAFEYLGLILFCHITTSDVIKGALHIKTTPKHKDLKT